MRIDNEFDVGAPLERVWNYMLDVEKVAPCVPGGELTEIVDGDTWKGKVNIKLGPVSLAFKGTVTVQERNEPERRVVLKAEGREVRGKGAATALTTTRLESTDGGAGTKVLIGTELTITGAVAQYGRGMIGDISQRITQQFAECLAANIAAESAAASAEVAQPEAASIEPANEPELASEPEPAPPLVEAAAQVPVASSPAPARPPAQTARPVAGIRMGVWALWRVVVRFVRRLFGGSR